MFSIFLLLIILSLTLTRSLFKSFYQKLAIIGIWLYRVQITVVFKIKIQVHNMSSP